jgi:S-disulfanyl-L-cysteine oxidoreductase SoxD
MRLLAVGIVATAIKISGGEPLLTPDDGDAIRAGCEVYVAQCASCHGANLEGQPNWMRRDDVGYLPAPPHDETGHTWHHPEAVLFDLTKHGLAGVVSPDYKTRMPALAGVLSDDEIIQALPFIKSQWPEEIRRRHDVMSDTSRASH